MQGRILPRTKPYSIAQLCALFRLGDCRLSPFFFFLRFWSSRSGVIWSAKE